MTVLITGGQGTIAQAIKEKLEDWEFEVLAPTRQELDVTNEANVKRYIYSKFPDILINCAGYIQPNKIKDSASMEFVTHFEVNVFGAYFCIKYFILSGGKKVINIGSTSALEGRDSWGAYCASKAALMSLTETIAKENVEAYNLHPSRTNTKMRDNLFLKEDKSTLMNPKRVADFVIKILNKEFPNGSSIIVKKDSHYVFPSRICA